MNRSFVPTALWRDERAIAAMELALLLPALLGGFLGILEFSRFYDARSRVEWTALAMGDIISQSSSQTQSQLTALGGAATSLMHPYSTTGLTVTATSLVVSNNTAVIDSSWGSQKALLGNAGDAVAFDAATAKTLIPSGKSVIYVGAKYVYQSYTGLPFLQGKVISATAYVMPRVRNVVTFN